MVFDKEGETNMGGGCLSGYMQMTELWLRVSLTLTLTLTLTLALGRLGGRIPI